MGTKDDATTVAGSRRRKAGVARSKRIFALTLAYHRDHRRTGQRALLDLDGEIEVSRKSPVFGPLLTTSGSPFDSGHGSRKPIRIPPLAAPPINARVGPEPTPTTGASTVLESSAGASAAPSAIAVTRPRLRPRFPAEPPPLASTPAPPPPPKPPGSKPPKVQTWDD